MSKHSWFCVAMSLVIVGWAAGALAAEPEAAGELPPGMTAEQMAAWQKAMTPGAHHAELAAMAGDWSFSGTFWMAPDAPPQESKGVVHRTMVLGGRVMTETVVSEMMGEKFEGLGMMGFDNVSGMYWGTWNDNMGTGLMTSTGTCTAGKCEFKGSYNCPMIGGPKTIRMTSVQEPNREVHVAFQAPDRARVRAFFDAAVAAGAEVLHEPRLWPEYHPSYYGAFVRDPDGNNVEAVCHSPE